MASNTNRKPKAQDSDVDTTANGDSVAVLPNGLTESENGETADAPVVKAVSSPKKSPTPKREKAPVPVKEQAPAKVYSGEAIRRAADTMKMLSDGTRATIAITLFDAPGTNVGDVCKTIAMSQPAISHHLAMMRHGGIVLSVRNGKNNNYELTKKGKFLVGAIKKLLDQLDD